MRDRVLGRCDVETLGRPACEKVRCLRRWPDRLELQWLAKTPLRAPVLECQVQVADFFSWQEVALSEMKVQEAPTAAKADAEFREETWQGLVPKLKVASGYKFRARARNSAGWSDFSEPSECRTSDVPKAPEKLRLLQRKPQKVEVEFEFEDAEGCPVSHIEPEFCVKSEAAGAVLPGESGDGVSVLDFTSWWWQTPEYFEVQVKEVDGATDSQKSAGMLGARSGSITVAGLKAEQTIWLRLWAVNQAGRSAKPSQPLPCRPSDRPGQVEELRVTLRGATWLELQWRTRDPEGAPVTNCRLEASRANFIRSWTPIAKSDLWRISANLWRARANNLEREADYQVRVVACNDVGWSLEPLQMGCRTAERPHKPRQLQCVDAGKSHIRIEFKVASNFGQEEHISKVSVEESGVLVWSELPPERLDFEHLGSVSASEAAPLTEDLGPFWDAEMSFKSFAVIVRGLEPNSFYNFRLAVANEVGWSLQKSEVLRCSTVCRPEKPQLLEGRKAAHEIRVFWDQADPLGGPVVDWEAQICEASIFSAWQNCQFLVLQQPTLATGSGKTAAFVSWEAGGEGPTFLQPSQFHAVICKMRLMCAFGWLRLRTGNLAGWSEWSAPLKAWTAQPPAISRCTLMRAATAAELASEGEAVDWIVDIFLKDSGCRPLVCAVDFEPRDAAKYQAFARHTSQQNWRAHFPKLPKDLTAATAHVTAGSAAGWCQRVTVASEKDAIVQEALACGADAKAVANEALHCLREFLSTEAELLSSLEQEMDSFLRRARAEGRCSAQHFRRLEHRLLSRALQAVRALATCAESNGFGLGGVALEKDEAWLSRCQNRLAHKDAVLDKERAGVSRGVQVHWEDNQKAASDSGAHQPARVVRLWAQKRETWATSHLLEIFSAERSNSLPAAAEGAGRLRARASSWAAVITACLVRCDASNLALASFDPSVPTKLREQTLQGLSALKNLRWAADHQLRKLQRALEMIAVSQHAVGSSERVGAHSFPEVSVTDKLSQTALGLILTMVMPVPGTVELGVVSIGALWLQGDSAGKHVVVEHPPPSDDTSSDPFGRFRQRPRPSALRLLQERASDGEEASPETGTVFVHNAASRMVTVRVLDQGRNIALRAYEKVQEAHPMVRLVSKAVAKGFGAVAGNSWTADSMPGVAIGPADAALLPLPMHQDSSFELEFAYGLLDSGERPLGRVPARTGMAATELAS
ncbi:unnamed protein product [Effrenium voratum]|nr:unnamed protein product [Effrenium voratum]